MCDKNILTCIEHQVKPTEPIKSFFLGGWLLNTTKLVSTRDENGRKRSEEASIIFSFTFFLGNDIDNSIDGNEYGADNTGTSETKLSDRE